MTGVRERQQQLVNAELHSFLAKEEFDEDLSSEVPNIGYRHVQVLLYFLGVVIAFGCRIVLTVTIVAMTDPTTNNNTDIPTYPEWTDKNIIQSAFFWGYILPQIFAGWAATKFSAKWFLVCTFSINSVAGLIIPQAAALLGSQGVMLCCILQGISQGFLFPMVTSLLSHWVPNKERSRLSTVVYAAGSFGSIVAILSTGIMCASPYGWPLAFYVYGILGVVWCILMSVFGYDSPAEHPSVGKAEKYYIESDINRDTTKKKPPTPWKAIATSKPVIALLFVQVGNNYSVWTLLTQTPSYIRYVMEFKIKDNAMLSALPPISQWLLSFAVGCLSDFIIHRGYISTTISRKLFSSLGTYLPAIALIMLSFTRSDQRVQAIALLIAAAALNSFHYAGFSVNAIDLSPNHSGIIFGICNAFSQIMGILAPMVVQYVVTEDSNVLQWRIVFLIAAVVNIVTSTLFNIWASAEVQPWNEHPEDDEDQEKC